jgi:signal peptide peptidase SppA
MMYPRIVLEFVGSAWALHGLKFEAIAAFIGTKAAGGRIPDDVRADYRAQRDELMARITQTQEDAARRSDGKIALIPVYGTLAQRMTPMMEMSGGMSTQMLGQAFRSALHDDRVSAIVFDIDSPGGTVAGTGELAAEILQSRGAKPIVAVANSMMASGALWIGAMADEVVITPGGEAGSVGVYRIHEDVTKALEKDGIKPTIVRSSQSPFKIEGSGLEPLTAGAQDHMQQSVDQAAEVFIRSLADARRKTLTHVRENFGQGRMLSASEALAAGMVDRIDTLEHTLERFGSGTFNAIANANAAERIARAEAREVLVAKWKAGDPPSTRELQDGLRGILGLSKAEAEQAVRLSFKGNAPGDPAPAEQPAITGVHVADIRTGVDGLTSALERLRAAL